jgi:alpha-tubulin suppressor-like RCC1 family protein
MPQIMEKFDVLNKLNDEFKQRVKILYVFEYSNVLIVTKDDKTYAFGVNSRGQLGFGHNKVVNETQIVEELSDQQIIDFANGERHCVARNSSGKVYCWGYNIYGCLGIGSQDDTDDDDDDDDEDDSYHKPKLNQYLNNEFVVDISCGFHHSLVLTNCGEVYAWGANDWGQIGNGCNDDQLIPTKVKGFNNERIVMISCGSFHSMALTECGHVYSWGYNVCGQLGIGNTEDSNEPKFVAVIGENKCNVFIEKISCGSEHSLLLSSDGNIYVFGRNRYGELGNQKEENIFTKSLKEENKLKNFLNAFRRNKSGEIGNHKVKNELNPHRIKMETKFIDISSRWIYSSGISIALSQNGTYYNWGKCGKEIIRAPKLTNLESFVEIYAKYLKITSKAINFEEQNSATISLENKFVKVKVNKTEYNLGSSVNRFNSKPNEIANSQLDFKELIGKGGFGEVYQVINRLDRQQYALKIIILRGKFNCIYEIFSIRVRINLAENFLVNNLITIFCI